jgi:hypothetical protein
VQIRFLYSEQCPSHDEALERLRTVLHEEGIQADIEVIRVETFEEARRYRFSGSPTILIDGNDIDPTPNPEYAPTCRAYRLEDGRISPLPSITLIRKAIQAWKENFKSRDRH